MSDHYTKAQFLSLLKPKADKVGTEDIEITDSDKGFIGKTADSTRVRMAPEKDGAVLVVGTEEVV